jgi:solute carrier family 13 (sodium-dependent dicarboxylate transporter), member 2/3/5
MTDANQPPPSEIAGSTGPAARIGLWLGPVLAIASLLLPMTGLAWEARLVLAMLILMATWWITEALPLAATALLPIVAVPLIGIDVGTDARGRLVCATEGLCTDALTEPLANGRILNLADLGAHYANPVVLLYIGGFLIGIAIERWGLSTRIAYGLVSRGGANPKLMLAGFLLAASFISMWISNTSTSLILTPLALSVAAGSAVNGREDPRFAAALVLGIAYAATVGGLATPIGTPPNGIALTQLRAQGVEISFGQWMAIGVPVVIVLLPVAWLILSRGLKMDAKGSAGAQARVREELGKLGPLSTPEGRTATIFFLIAGLWMISTLIAEWIGSALLGGTRIDSGHVDTMIATLGALLLFIVPAGGGANRPILIWEDAQKIPWGILLLFGGGLALAAAAELSGLSRYLAQSLEGVADLHPAIVILLVGLIVIVITEFASNIATISLMGPVLISLAAGSETLGAAAFIVPAAMAASMGFAMPVGSASNAIAYGTGRVKQADMIRRGLVMNLCALVVLTIVGLTLAPLVLGGA